MSGEKELRPLAGNVKVEVPGRVIGDAAEPAERSAERVSNPGLAAGGPVRGDQAR
jgi:hypothetical protein